MPAKRNVTVPASKPAKPVIAKPVTTAVAPVTAKPVATAPVAAVPTAVSADTSAQQLAKRELKIATYLAVATYPSGTISAADFEYLGYFAEYAKRHNGTVNLAALDIAHKAAKRIVNNGARAHRLAAFGLVTRTGDTATEARVTISPAVTAATAPNGASATILTARSIYASAKA